ncbi:protein PHLOEM PROTEIN 2-LIKE A1-like [Prunus yedoensis var. nudiflora]|uniref:Protein PHLOEM PROTEIN 2-LIKE A1-like n=1 Tax=Prunus yedoensis var. nudiflora TaxID=2094558 RepID=A0A314Z7S4_PRUYE|nr:protein PHLOEM PROTEIN 2-LIKE A1-like [Prunus yedoensis var. nudiflora]
MGTGWSSNGEASHHRHSQQNQLSTMLRWFNFAYTYLDQKSNKCFLVYAKALDITWSGDPRHWRSVQETSDGPTEAAELLKMQAKAYGWDVPVNLKLTVPHASDNRWSKVNLADKAREQWIEIPIGNFIASPQKPGDLEFSLYEYDGRWKSGLVIKGVVVRPKY